MTAMAPLALPETVLAQVRALVRQGGAYAHHAARRRTELTHATKAGPQDPVTEIDLAIERMILAGLQALFPQDRFWGEESGWSDGALSGRVWICDPIDGTRSFLRLGHDYCVSLGLLVDGQISLGMIFDPERDDFYEARLGEGAWLNGVRLQLRPIPDLSHGLIGIGYSERVRPQAHAAAIEKLLVQGSLCHQHGSGALALAQVAAGRLDAYLELHQNAWDALPGLLIAEEAGAQCLAWEAADLLRGSLTLAANPGIGSALALIATGSPSPRWGIGQLRKPD